MINFHIPELRASSYRVSIEAAALRRAPTREPMIEYLFRVLDGDQQGQRRRSLQIITSETYAGTIRNLRVCGVEYEPRDIAGHLPQARGVELDIEITDASAVVLARRLDDRGAAERGVTEAAEPLTDVAAALFPLFEVCDVEEWSVATASYLS